MIRKFFLPAAALCGIAFAIFTVVQAQKPVPSAPPVAAPAEPSFRACVAGAGIIEAATENIAIGTPVGNVVTEVLVQVGDHVKKGDPLFRLRDLVIQAEVESKKAAHELARAKLERLRNMPRPEQIPPLEARVREAEASLDDQKNTLALWESVPDPRAVSKDVLSRQRFAVKTAEARLAAARAELAELKAGAWKADIGVAEAEVYAALSDVHLSEADLERRTIRAPVNCVVLQVKTRPGEYAQPGPLATPLMIVGSLESFHVRVDVDENDAWRVKPGAHAEASLRGNAALRTPIEFVRVEPYVVPKRSLTGDSTERVDTRVLQVIYRFPPDALPAYVGQQVDVFIEAEPLDPALRATESTPPAPAVEKGSGR
jgi:HlyD family secretion protein